jgi:hypothetical protein
VWWKFAGVAPIASWRVMSDEQKKRPLSGAAAQRADAKRNREEASDDEDE